MKKSLANSAAFLCKRCLSTTAAGSAGFSPSTATAKRAGAAGNRNRNTAPFAPVVASLPGYAAAPRALSSASGGTLPRDSDRGGAVLRTPSGTALHLPPADAPVGLGLYEKAVHCPATGVMRTSAHVGSDDRGRKVGGTVGVDVTPEAARTHARNAGLRLLATLHAALDGDLGRVERVLHLRGIVRAAPDFEGHAGVVDGCSEVLVEALGLDVGVGTRECFGAGSLGGGGTVACTLEVRVRPLE